MRWILSFFVVVVVTLSLAMGMGVGTIAAQEDTDDDGEVYPGEQGPNSPNDTDDEQDDGGDRDGDRADDELEDRENATVSPDDDFLREIDTKTRITDWSYEPGMFTIQIEADEPTRVSMTEAGDFERGTGSFNYQEVELDEGTNTVTMPVTDRQGAGVAIATRRSLEQGTGAFVSVGQLERNPFRHFGGESGLFTGVGLSVALAALSAAYVIRTEESGVMKA